jgi:hypothetical protein
MYPDDYRKRVDFSSDEMMFYYPDIHESNFLIDKAGQLYVIDFQDEGFLPESFMSFVPHGATHDKRLAELIYIV